jgi:hypothetical protein
VRAGASDAARQRGAPVAGPGTVVLDSPVPEQQRRFGTVSTLIASARRLRGASRTKGGSSAGTVGGWQEDAWRMYDLVGELRFLSNTLAGQMGRARFYVGQRPDDPTEDLEPVTEGAPVEVFEAIFGTGGNQAGPMITRLGVNLTVAGEGWVIGVPPAPEEAAGSPEDPEDGIAPGGQLGTAEDGEVDFFSLVWGAYSTGEVKWQNNMLTLPDHPGRSFTEDEAYQVRIWRSHPNSLNEADSPTRSALPVLRELVGSTMHISAQIDSRLAGAGMLLVPQSADRAVKAAAGADSEEDDNPFLTALMEAMITPIADRSSASAVVPLTSAVPDDSIDKFRWMSFTTPLDGEAREIRNESIRRLALSQDAPPEVLLGVGGMNHWGAWLVHEDTVTTHIEPPLGLICNALTTMVLWPVLQEGGMSQEEAERFVLAADVDDLIIRPNRGQDAKDLYGVGALRAETLRDANGFGEEDAPPATERIDPLLQVALDLVQRAPTLAANPGIPAIVDQLRVVYGKKPQHTDVDPITGGEPAEDPASADTPPVEQPAQDDVPAGNGPPDPNASDGPDEAGVKG